MVGYLLAFTVYPIVDNVYVATTSGALANLLTLPSIVQTLVNTAVFSAGTVVVEFVGGFALALAVDRVRRGTPFFTSVFVTPLLVSPVAIGVVWLLILDPQFGPLNAFLSVLGIRGPFWVGQQNTIMMSAIVASAWEETPIVFLVCYAGLKGIPKHIYEAAAVDGLSGLSLIRNVTLPMMKPTLAVAGLLALMTSFRSFDLVYMFAINGPFVFVQTLPFMLYQVAFVSNFQEFGSALSILIMVIALVPTFVLLRLMKVSERLGLAAPKGLEGPSKFRKFVDGLVADWRGRRRERRSLARRELSFERKQYRPSRMSKLTQPLIYAFLLVVAAIMIFPVYWIFTTSLKTANELFPAGGGIVVVPFALDPSNWILAIQELSGYMTTSVVVTVAVVLLTIAASVPAAYSISRFKTGGTSIVSWNIIVNSMPSVIFVIPLFYYAQTARIYDTWFALISTYLVFTIPIAVWLLIGFVEEIPKQIDDAARIDGLGTPRIVSKIIFPLIKPGLISVVVLAIINCWHEFLFTLILGLTVFDGHVPVGARGVTVYISNFVSATGINWATISAGAILISLPLILLVIFLQKYFIGGLTLGSVRG